MANQSSANWYADDMPKLRMAAGKSAESKPVSIRPVDLRSTPSLAEPPRRWPSALLKWAWRTVGAALAVVLLWWLIDHLLVARVVLPAANGAARHTLLRYLWYSPQRGDRIVISDHSQLAVKRIIARPSDWLKLRDGVVYLNGKKVNEQLKMDSREKSIQLGENQYYVVGGPEAGGALSHGLVSKKDIVGRLRE
jgi:hypothetical protein